MKFRNRAVFLLPIALLLCVPMFAQTTAAITGNVTTDGAPLPGVVVTISSPALQGTRTTVTGDNGGYYFGAVPPGRYTVRFELEGMTTVTRTVDVGVAQTGRANAEMRLSAVAEALTVTAAAPSVLETTEVATNISGDLVEQLPIARTVIAAALLAPGVNDNTFAANQLSISGSPGYDNLVMVNGIVITENVRSQALQLYVEDAIQETTVLTGAISAEYGRFTGGVVNSITKSGGNEFSGSLRAALTNPAWTKKTDWPKSAPGRTQADPIDDLNEVYSATLGGFLLRDRLWFFGAARTTESSAELFMRPVPGSTISERVIQTSENDKWEAKLTGQITQNHSLVGSYYTEDALTVNSRFTAVSYGLDSISGPRQDPKELISAFYNGVITNNFLVEARYSQMEYGIGHGSGSLFTDLIRGTIVRNRADGSARYNSPTFCGVCDQEWRNNDGWVAKASYFLSSPSLGNHNLVGGYETFSEQRYANNYQSGSNFRFFVNSVQRIGDVFYPTVQPGTGGAAAYFAWTPIFEGAQESDLATDSIFINDRWDLNPYLSFNIGVRYDQNDGRDGSGNVTSDDAKISPRLGATWDIFGNGRHRVQASYGQYVSRVGEGPGTSANAAGSPAYIEFMYNGPAINPAGTPTNQLVDTHTALQMVFNWLNSTCNAQGKCGVENLDLLRVGGVRSVPGYSATISDQLSSPYVEEIQLGYGVQIGRNAVVKVDGIMRDWKDFYGFRRDVSTPRVVDFLNIGQDVSVVENTNLITREYRGIQFQGAWRPSRFNMGLNYTWSELKGNDEQESAVSGTVGNSPGEIWYPELLAYDRRLPQGILAQDSTHRARTWVGYSLPMGRFGDLSASVLHNFDTGLPYSAVGTILVRGAGTGAPTTLVYNAPPSTGQYYFSERGEFRLPDIQRTDVGLNYGIPIWRTQLFVEAEMLNVFNRQDLVSIATSVNARGNSTAFTPFNPFTTSVESLIECPQGTPAAQCTAMGAHWQKASNFGQPTGPGSYQLPRTYRFSVGVRF
jgi:hypothetical protein